MSKSNNPVILKPARDLIPGDIVLHQGYPADLIQVEVCAGGLIKMVWGVDQGDRTFVSPVTLMPVHGHFDA